MKGIVSLIFILVITLLACNLAKTPQVEVEELTFESPAPDRFTIVRLKTGDGQLETLLNSEVQKARQLGQNPYVEFYANWCPPCNALRQSLSDERMIDAFSGTYIIQLNLDEWRNELPGAGFNVRGIPAFYEIDESGKPTGRIITGGAWGEDIPENMAPPLKTFFRNS